MKIHGVRVQGVFTRKLARQMARIDKHTVFNTPSSVYIYTHGAWNIVILINKHCLS